MSAILNQPKIQAAKDIQEIEELLNGNLNPDQVCDRVAALIHRLDQDITRVRQVVSIDRDSLCSVYSILRDICRALKIEYKITLIHNHQKIDTVII